MRQEFKLMSGYDSYNLETNVNNLLQGFSYGEGWVLHGTPFVATLSMGTMIYQAAVRTCA